MGKRLPWHFWHFYPAKTTILTNWTQPHPHITQTFTANTTLTSNTSIDDRDEVSVPRIDAVPADIRQHAAGESADRKSIASGLHQRTVGRGAAQ